MDPVVVRPAMANDLAHAVHEGEVGMNGRIPIDEAGYSTHETRRSSMHGRGQPSASGRAARSAGNATVTCSSRSRCGSAHVNDVQSRCETVVSTSVMTGQAPRRDSMGVNAAITTGPDA